MGVPGLGKLVRPLCEKGYVPGILRGLRVTNDGTKDMHTSRGKETNRKPAVYRQDHRNAIKDILRLYKALTREIGEDGSLHICWEGNTLPGKGATITGRRTYASLKAAINTLQSRAYYFAKTGDDSNQGEAPPLETEDAEELQRMEAQFREAETEQKGASSDLGDDIGAGWTILDVFESSASNPTDAAVKKAYLHLGRCEYCQC